jgi:hypothetical protein
MAAVQLQQLMLPIAPILPLLGFPLCASLRGRSVAALEKGVVLVGRSRRGLNQDREMAEPNFDI